MVIHKVKPAVSIIMRSYNDGDIIKQTLESLKAQTFQDYELWNHDSGSSDNTLQVIKQYFGSQNIRINSNHTYIPGKVLNRAVKLCQGEIVVFLNSDATPTSKHWLSQLVASIKQPNISAVYGRQIARNDCKSLFVKDTERAFGDGHISANWENFFSMANAASYRSVLLEHPFCETLGYSEDIEWSYRLRKSGLILAYDQSAACTHSHNYSLSQSYKRHYGEGVADAQIFTQGQVNFNFYRYSLLPFVMEVVRDIVWAWQTKCGQAVVHSIPLRCTQKWARWQGCKRQLGA